MATEPAEEEGGVFDPATMEMLSANLPQNMFRTPDPRLQRAVIEAERTNQMTPMLKEELRLRILTKRLERGEPELQTEFTPKTYELTEEEKEKREKRKAQNRKAAKRCREKRKMKNLDMAEKCELVNEKHEQLKNEISQLHRKEKILQAFLRDHVKSGQCRLVSNNASSSVANDQSAKLQQGTHQNLSVLAGPSRSSEMNEDAGGRDVVCSPTRQLSYLTTDASPATSSLAPLIGTADPTLILCVENNSSFNMETDVSPSNSTQFPLESDLMTGKNVASPASNMPLSDILGSGELGCSGLLGYLTLSSRYPGSPNDISYSSSFGLKSNDKAMLTSSTASPSLTISNIERVQNPKIESERASSSCVHNTENHNMLNATIRNTSFEICHPTSDKNEASSHSPGLVVAPFQPAPYQTPISSPSSVVSLSPTSPNSISGEMLSPGVNHSPFDLAQMWAHKGQSLTTTAGVPTSTRSSTPKPTTSSRQPFSRASSTASLPPPQSPCPSHHTPPTMCVLTPPPSVSSEFITVPESPSMLSTPNRDAPMDASGIHCNFLIMAGSVDGYNPEMSPISPQSRTSATLDVSVDANMFDDDDDDDGTDNDILLANVDPDLWQGSH